MDIIKQLIQDKPVLFYSGRCGKCRVLSQLVVWASFHTVHRIPIESDVAEEFYQTYPDTRGKLTLFHRSFRDGKFAVGNWVYIAVPWLILKTWLAIGWCTLKNAT